MMRRAAAGFVALGLVSLAGCAYFNGLYNANQLADEAEDARREGRVGEARSLWSQAAVKAESVAVRYPRSGYRDDALLLQGRALLESEQYRRALAPLQDALELSADAGTQAQARLLLGRCYFELGDFARVVDVLAPFAQAGRANLADEARLWRGRALMATGAPDAAAADLERSGLPDAKFHLAVAHARRGVPEQARSALEGRVWAHFDEARWLATLDSVGTAYPAAASAIVDLLLLRVDLTAGQRARLAVSDGRRWVHAGLHESAIARFELALLEAADSGAGRAALVDRSLAQLQRPNALDSLGSIWGAISHARSWPDSAGRKAAAAATILEPLVVVLLADAAGGFAETHEHADLDLFVAGEALRDSLGADDLAASVFLEIPMRFPRSPIAPKAMLAAASLMPAGSDSLLAELGRQYPTSPYTLVLSGIGAAAYAALEDSIRSVQAARRIRIPRNR